MQTSRKKERERQTAKSRANEKTTEIERKRIGTTSPVSSSSILRKSSPKMVGRAKRVRVTKNVTSSSPSRYHRHDRESRSPSWRTVIAVDINAGGKSIGDNTSISIADDCNPTPATVTAEVAARSLYARMKRNPPRMYTIAKAEKAKMYTKEREKEKERDRVSLQPPERKRAACLK